VSLWPKTELNIVHCITPQNIFQTYTLPCGERIYEINKWEWTKDPDLSDVNNMIEDEEDEDDEEEELYDSDYCNRD